MQIPHILLLEAWNISKLKASSLFSCAHESLGGGLLAYIYFIAYREIFVELFY